MSDDDQISPQAIKRCDMCAVKNFARGGRTNDRRFHPVYEGEDAMQRRIVPKVGSLAWCGRSGPEHLLRVIRIVCTRVEVDGAQKNLCQRCAREALKQRRNDPEEVAA